MNLTEREAKSMHQMKKIFDAYHELPLSIRMELRDKGFAALVDGIEPVLKLYKDDVRGEIVSGVAVSGINKRFGVIAPIK